MQSVVRLIRFSLLYFFKETIEFRRTAEPIIVHVTQLCAKEQLLWE